MQAAMSMLVFLAMAAAAQAQCSCTGGTAASGAQCQPPVAKCATCDSGRYLASDACLECGDANCATCTSSSCTKCKADWILDGSACIKCTGGAATKCNACTGSYPAATSCAACAGVVKDGNVCVQVPCITAPGDLTTSNAYDTTSCSGTTVHGSSCSVPCAAGWMSVDGGTAAATYLCSDGNYGPMVGSLPTCQIRNCRTGVQETGLTFDLTGCTKAYVHETCTVKCHADYVAASRVYTCTSDDGNNNGASFTSAGATLTCNPKPCTGSVLPIGAVAEQYDVSDCTGMTRGSTCKVRCSADHDPVARPAWPGYYSCGAGPFALESSSSLPTCIAKPCLQFPADVALDKNALAGITANQKRNVPCKAGYGISDNYGGGNGNPIGLEFKCAMGDDGMEVKYAGDITPIDPMDLVYCTPKRCAALSFISLGEVTDCTADSNVFGAGVACKVACKPSHTPATGSRTVKMECVWNDDDNDVGWQTPKPVCQQNVCTCTNGGKATDTDCTASGPKCVTCDRGYNLNGDTAACDQNVCTCANGDGTTGEDCETHDAAKCASCNEGHALTGTVCEVIEANSAEHMSPAIFQYLLLAAWAATGFRVAVV